MSRFTLSDRARRIIRSLAMTLCFAALVVLLMMYLAGSFEKKIDPNRKEPPAYRPVPAGAAVVEIATIELPTSETAVGSIRPVYESQVASKLLAKVLQISVTAGQPVKTGEVLVKLDEADLHARLRQAEANLAAARAAADQARTELDAKQKMFANQAGTKIELERADTAYKTAAANVNAVEQAVAETRSILDYATIRSPMDGLVVDKKVNVGDTVSPGQVLLTLYDPTRMQLIASVRESLARRLVTGQQIGVAVDALNLRCHGSVSEIVPESQSASRSFSVKVTGPCPPGVMPGMFGRIYIPLDMQKITVVPAGALQRIGQLDMVNVVNPERQSLERRTVQLGRSLNWQGRDIVEILSGLRAGEQVLMPSEDRSHG